MGDGGGGGGDPSVGAMSTAPSSVPTAQEGGHATRENGHCTDAKQEGQCAPMRCGWCTTWLTRRTVAKILSSTRDKNKIRTVQFSAPTLGRPPPNPHPYPNPCFWGGCRRTPRGWMVAAAHSRRRLWWHALVVPSGPLGDDRGDGGRQGSIGRAGGGVVRPPPCG